MKGRFLWFYYLFKNNDSVYLEDRAIEQIILNIMWCICIMFSKWFEIVKVRYLSLNFLWRLPQFSGRDASSPLPSLPNGMKNMAATWCKDKVSNAENLLCIVIVYLHRLELIKKYFVSTRKIFEHEIYKLILQNYSSLSVLCTAYSNLFQILHDSGR